MSSRIDRVSVIIVDELVMNELNPGTTWSGYELTKTMYFTQSNCPLESKVANDSKLEIVDRITRTI